MPNKRKKGKRLVAGWLPEAEVEEFKALKENEARILNKKYTLEDLTLENMFS